MRAGVVCGAVAVVVAIGGCGGDDGGDDDGGAGDGGGQAVTAAEFKSCVEEGGAIHKPASEGDDVGKALRDEGLAHEAFATGEDDQTNSFVRVFADDETAGRAVAFLEDYTGGGANYSDSTRQQRNVTYFPYTSEDQKFIDDLVDRCAPES